MTPRAPLLAVEDLHTYYGEAHILQGVSMTVGEGEVVTLIGRNGAGKTTTLRSIMGVARPRRGRVVLRGEDVTGLGSHEISRRGIAWVPEERRVLPNLTVLENLRLGALGAGRDNGAASFDDVLAFFPRLRERIAQKGRFLSGGEQQMLAIARGLVARSRLMLVDEPTEGLAPLLVENLTGILEEISRRGTTILLVEQTLEVAMRLSHRLYVMDQGRIQFEGTPEELRREPTIQQRFLGVSARVGLTATRAPAFAGATYPGGRHRKGGNAPLLGSKHPGGPSRSGTCPPGCRAHSCRSPRASGPPSAASASRCARPGRRARPGSPCRRRARRRPG